MDTASIIIIVLGIFFSIFLLFQPTGKKGGTGQEKEVTRNEPSIAETLQPGELMDTDTGEIYSHQLHLEANEDIGVLTREIERLTVAVGKIEPTTKAELKQRKIIVDALGAVLAAASKLYERAARAEFAEYQAAGFSPRAGHVYVLTNEAFPGLIKVGMTTRPVSQRVRELQSTGVPYPFEVAHSVRVPDCAVAERIIHAKLKEHRVNDGREFFRLPVSDAIAAVNDTLAQ